MTEPLQDTFARDIAVLTEVVRDQQTHVGAVYLAPIAQQLNLTTQEMTAAVLNLERGAYVTLHRDFVGEATHVASTTERALRESGVWPTPETAFDRMIAALENIAENTNDEDTRTRARKILDSLGGTGKQIGVSVATAMITGQIT